MKTNRGLFFILALGFAASAVAAEPSFSVKSWQKELSVSLENGDRNISKLLDISITERKVFTTEKDTERKSLLTARELFAKDKFPQALALYDQVSKSSDEWLEVTEEKGWAFHRQNDFEKALAQTKTLLSQPLIQIVGSEPFFLQSLTQLKICDYAGVLATHQLFKDTQRERVQRIQELAQDGTSPAFVKVIEKADEFPMSFVDVGQEAKDLPRLFFRDLELQKSLLETKMSSVGVALIKEKMGIRPSSQKSQLTKSLATLEKTEVKSRARLKRRIIELASIENGQNKKILQKLNLVEIETIERMHTDQDLDRKSFHQGEYAQTTDQDLIFPDDGKPWMDELDRYQVKANTCPQNIRRKM